MQAMAICALVLAAAVGMAFAQGGGADLTGSDLQKLAGGFQFTEGPMWHPDGFLIFSDIPGDTIFALKEGKAEVYRKPSGNSNGLTFDSADRLVACEHGNRRVSVTQADGTVAEAATHYDGKRLNSPNDVVAKADGSVYFTDPPYGVRPADRELDFAGVYRISPDGEITLLVDDFVKPNGLCFSPDESLLYIADTDGNSVRAFDVQGDGTLANGRTLIKFEPPAELRPDGMKVDTEGNLFVAGAGGVEVFGPDGEHLQTIEVPDRPSNLAFGDADGRTLYITARSSVYSIRTVHPGAVIARRLAAKRE